MSKVAFGRALCGASLAAAIVCSDAARAQSPADEFRAEVEEAERLGRLLFEHDRAAAVATDAIVEKYGTKQGDARGWIEERVGDDAFSVIFYRENGERFSPVFAASVAGGKVGAASVRRADDETFSEDQLAKVRARERALKEPKSGCAKEYNTVVIPDDVIGFFVYVLAASRDPNAVVIGGHLRHDINPAGETVVGFKKFTNTCIVLGKPPLKREEQVVALAVSQVLTRHPTEIHVMASLLHDLPLYVITGRDEIWEVRNGDISFTER